MRAPRLNCRLSGLTLPGLTPHPSSLTLSAGQALTPPMPRGWLGEWLKARAQALAEGRLPAPLRQSVWCANGLHGQCQGWTQPRDVPVTCLCPCHAQPATDDDPA